MTFSPDIVSAVLAHMNSDHVADSLTIARAALARVGDTRGITSAVMTEFDGEAAYWSVTTEDGDPIVLEVPWPQGPISERAEVRRELVALTEQAYAELGLPFERH